MELGRDVRVAGTVVEHPLGGAVDPPQVGSDAGLETRDVGGERTRHGKDEQVHAPTMAWSFESIQLIVPMQTMKPVHDPDRAPGLLEVRHLRLVRAIASEGSVTRAAALLHLSQSAVSHQLLALEDALG